MNTISRTVTGSALILVGAAVMLVSLFLNLFLLIYGVPMFVIGWILLFNKKEDHIEPIKERTAIKKES